MISSPRYLRTGFFISVPVPFITRSILILAPQDVLTVKSTQDTQDILCNVDRLSTCGPDDLARVGVALCLWPLHDQPAGLVEEELEVADDLGTLVPEAVVLRVLALQPVACLNFVSMKNWRTLASRGCISDAWAEYGIKWQYTLFLNGTASLVVDLVEVVMIVVVVVVVDSVVVVIVVVVKWHSQLGSFHGHGM